MRSLGNFIAAGLSGERKVWEFSRLEEIFFGYRDRSVSSEFASRESSSLQKSGMAAVERG